ncbi:hypothetical protein [Nakamurella sp. PAMC28650]|jgi:hypothetical protein|uniref:hypothetical protein n=1 Tax=Nakamurella sp. PAMC28650 TaxID=2762325 RepID=UPI00164D9285|nr:hypothetical protein [Nakamurella sp. PAMC28650]QNK82699.1 hypothetical protein H7F38_08365 [Nakamurella sp. PAMC28650]
MSSEQKDISSDQEKPVDPTPPAERSVGWSASEVVHDHGDQPAVSAGWSGDEVVEDRGDGQPDGPDEDGGWSGDEVVKDQPHPIAGKSGWSGGEVVGERHAVDDPD